MSLSKPISDQGSAKTPKRKCKFTDLMRSKYSCFSRGRNEYEGKCTLCDSFVSVSSHGSGDLERHISSEKHRNVIRGSSSSSKIDTFFAPNFTALDKKVQAAEATMAFHTVVHHHSFKSVDCTAKLNKTIFPDSEISQKIKCGRTKTEAIITNVLAPHALENVIETLQTSVQYFSIATDASNHGSLKLFPLVVQYFSEKSGIELKLLELQTLKEENSKAISDYICKTLDTNSLSSKCLAYSGDNANVNFGGWGHKEGNNVFTHLKQSINENMIGIGCPAHILHNTVQHGHDNLPIDIESIVMKIHNYFHIFTIRTEKLKDFCEEADLTYQALLSHSKTRWLSLYPAIEKILKIYPALKEYFENESKASILLKKFFADESSEAYLWFVHANISLFHTKVAQMEREKNSLLEVMGLVNSLKEALRSRIQEKFLSLQVKQKLLKIESEDERLKIKDNCMNFYITCLEYLQKWTEQFQEFTCFEWLNLKKSHSNLESLQFDELSKCIEYLNNKQVQIDESRLFDQFCSLKMYLSQIETFKDTSAEQWCDYFNKNYQLELKSELLKICEFFFAIPCHNGNVERIFSLISSQWTDERNRLLTETVRGLIFVKYNLRNFSCEDFYKYLMSSEEKNIQKLLKSVHTSEKYKQ